MNDRAELKKKNMRAFESRHPSLAQTLATYTPQSRLVELPDGGWDTEFAGQRFYDGDPKDFVADQIEAVRTEPMRYIISPPDSTTVDAYAGEFLFNFLKRSQDDVGVTYQRRPVAGRTFFLVVYGIGLMPHFDDLFEATNPTCIMLVDPNPEFLYHTLEIFDWAEAFDRVEAKGGNIAFSISDQPEKMSLDIRIWLRTTNPCSVDGTIQFMHYNHPVFQRIRQILHDDKDIFLSGLGFFYDETIMIRNAHANLYGGETKVYLRPNDDARIDVPVFVIGSGPSIDKDIEFLRANRDKAVYITCGSALRVLTVNGIVPDFHVEIENINVEPIISQVAKYCDLSSVNLVTASTVDQTIIPFFKNVQYYFRASLSPFPIFCETERRCLRFPSPTVVNAGASFAQEVGFRKIYLFGTDMGTKNRALHHSKHGYQYTEEHDKLLEAGKFRMPAPYTDPVPGNFGGTAYTSTDMYWTIDMLKILFTRHNKGRTYFNCSDGAYIDGTLPQPSKLLKLPDIGDAKDKAVAKVLEAFPVYTQEMFNIAWRDEDFISSWEAYLNDVRGILGDYDTFEEKGYLMRINHLLTQPYGRLAKAMAVLVRGTIWQILMAFEFYDSRCDDDERRADIHRVAHEEMLKILDKMEGIAIEKLGELTKKSDAGIAIDPWD